jgi:hypothetical protein
MLPQIWLAKFQSPHVSLTETATKVKSLLLGKKLPYADILA